MKNKLLLATLFCTAPLIAEVPRDKHEVFGDIVKLTPTQRRAIIHECNTNFMAFLRLLDELKEMNWAIPRKPLRDMAMDAIKGALAGSQSGDKKVVVMTALFNVVIELSHVTWDQYWEYKDKVAVAEQHYDNYLFYKLILENDK